MRLQLVGLDVTVNRELGAGTLPNLTEALTHAHTHTQHIPHTQPC